MKPARWTMLKSLRRFELWTARQRGTVIFLLLALLVFLTIRHLRNPLYVSDPQPRDPPRVLELADRIDPNTADEHTLAALPMIGPRRARDIVEYRERFVRDNPGKLAFTRIEDMVRIKGFGVAMMSHLRPYLIFPASSPTTRPP